MESMVLNDPVKIFVSSKQSEFQVERALLKREIEGLGLAFPVLAEDWPPGSASIQDVFMARVRSCPIYVGLFGQVYSEPTATEYIAASENPYREILIYLRQCDQRDPQLIKLIHVIQSKHVTAPFTNAADLVARFKSDLISAIGRMVASLVGMGAHPPTGHSLKTDSEETDTLNLARGETGNPLERRWFRKRDQLLGLGIPSAEIQGQLSFDIAWIASLEASLRSSSKML